MLTADIAGKARLCTATTCDDDSGAVLRTVLTQIFDFGIAWADG